mgnify:CR=1 FL=1
MNKKPKVTIVIATFNAERTLKNALESIINQSFQDWECIIVDGSSQDNTINIIKTYTKRDNRIRYASEPDKGVYDAFNKGWKMSKGEWIYYLGCDDILTQNGLEILINNSENTDIVYGDIIYKSKSKEKPQISLSIDKLKGNMICHQALIMKRSVIAELGGFDLQYKISADFDLFQNALSQKKIIKYVSTYVAYFNTTGISNRGVEILKEAFIIRKKYHTNSKYMILYLYLKSWLKRKAKFFIKCT